MYMTIAIYKEQFLEIYKQKTSMGGTYINELRNITLTREFTSSIAESAEPQPKK